MTMHSKSSSNGKVISTPLPVDLPTKEELLVQGLEAIQPAYAEFPGSMYAGRIPMDRLSEKHGPRTGKTMFWLFEPQQQSVEKTMMIWLNGGPGCSSFNCGVLMEHSPVTQPLHNAGYCCLESHPLMEYNNHTWTKATTMLYVEHPIGTGFSRGEPLPENEAEASLDLHSFLQNFLDIFTHLREYKFFVFGESYAGMFVPSVARWIHVMNQQQTDPGRIIQLSGAAIGNGWMNGYVQGPAVIDYSWYHGLIDQPTRDALFLEWEHCMNKTGSEQAPFHPFTVQDDCGIMWGVLQAAGNPNAYDVTTWDPNVDQITFSSEVFYNDPRVKAILHAPEDVTWHGCIGFGRRRRMVRRALTATDMDTTLDSEYDQDMAVVEEDIMDSLHPEHAAIIQHHRRRLYMDNDRPVNVVPYVAELLDAGIPVIVYNGDRDMTTNMVGSEILLNTMDWNGKKGWQTQAKRGVWRWAPHRGAEGGWAKEYNNLTFVVVYNSGHMVPYNVPDAAFDLVERFMRGQSFIDLESPMIRFENGGNQGQDSIQSGITKLPFGESTKKSHSSDHMVETSLTAGSILGTGGGATSQSDKSVVGSGRGFMDTVQPTIAMAFVVGMCTTWLLMLLLNRRMTPRTTSSRGYERIAEAEL